jgi:hypothetical protein
VKPGERGPTDALFGFVPEREVVSAAEQDRT